MNNKPFSVKERIKSFTYAFNGLKLFFVSEHNGRIHLVAAIIAIGLSFYLHLSTFEWIAILGVIAAVFITEILNSSIEKLADVVTTEINPKIKIVKDLAAAAVLVSAILALAVGCLIFIPKLLN